MEKKWSHTIPRTIYHTRNMPIEYLDKIRVLSVYHKTTMEIVHAEALKIGLAYLWHEFEIS